MSEECVADLEGRVLTLFHLMQEILTVELVNLLDVTEDNVPFTAQCLGHIFPHDLWYVMVDDVL